MAFRNTMLGVRTIASAAGDGLISSAVHIRVYPRPRNLAESREILRVLEGYGKVVMYKHLKDSSSAEKLIKDSPFRFKIEKKGTEWTFAGSEIEGHHTKDITAHSNGDGSPRLEEKRQAIEEEKEEVASTAEAQESQDSDGNQKMSATSKHPGRPIGQVLPPKGSLTDPSVLPSLAPGQQPSLSSDSASQASQPDGPRVRNFQLKIVPSVMNHQVYIERQGYYAEFMPDSKTIMGADLEDRVPLAGLMDCHVKKEEAHLRIRIDRKNSGVLEPFSIQRLWEERDRV
ncbi:MAG: hypothetical protein Q9195_000763 [Heterodermia aff. obscurata]